ncbi:DUF5753 domain-containing protein [Amycolatopsis sp.]|jgi:hypothetical protein|uniref:DUF5753 domain-containing protein n=1 Tax=Amycolatopsis sp. TaxID=37632 RepID=UPI002E0B4558|nr:DUF5753 domain-containing protein [Amycolatopsis sp.]
MEIRIREILLVCNVNRDEREELLRLSRELGFQGWLQQYDHESREQPRTLVEQEAKATSCKEVQLVTIPRLLQTESYARAVISRGINASGKRVELLVRTRLARQDIFLRSPPPRMAFFVHESILRAITGDRVIMAEQLHHLLRYSVRPNVELRVIPISAGAHVAQTGSFTLLEFADFTPIVHLEGELSAAFLEQPHQISAYQRLLSTSADSALSRDETKKMITTLATEYTAATECLAEVGSSMAEIAANLRRTIESGAVPPKAAARMAAFLEDLAIRASGEALAPETADPE